MANCLRLALLLSMASLCAVQALAQQDPPAPQTETAEAATAPPDQEVEVNEDNYRQFMELEDDLRQRTVVPEDSFESRSGLQKLDNLPEASQKHLRNELREIISRGDRWQPGDENAEYPYVPSEAAAGNARLQKQEAEAWGELLDNYHAREAQIYANSARSRAAVAASGTGPGQPGGSSPEQGEQAGQAAQAGQDQGAQAGSEGDSFAPNAQDSEGAQRTTGVAQNALEFLQNAGAAAQSGAAQAASGESGEPAGEGVEQNAMEFLQQAGQRQGETTDAGFRQAGDGSETGPDGDQPATSTGQAAAVSDAREVTLEAAASESEGAADEGVSQNALEYLAGEAAPGGEASPDTLTIEDLLKARGVASGVGDSQDDKDEPQPDPPIN